MSIATGSRGTTVSKQDYAIGIDIGGGSTKIGLVSSAGQVVEQRRITVVRGDDASAEEIVKTYAISVREVLAGRPDIHLRGIGVGFPGPIHADHKSGTLGNIPALDDIPLAQMIADACGIPCRLENDATAAGIAEATFGRHSRSNRLLLVTAGTGIGVAFTVAGKPFVTSGGCLGDAGHIIVQAGGARRCRQGCFGCLESLASGDALNGAARRYCADNPRSMLATDARRLDREPDGSVVIACARSGDADCLHMLTETGRWLGRGAATWAHIFAPDTILLGGGLSAAGDLLLRPMEQEARACGLEMYLRNVSFSLASLGNDAGMIGAAAQFLPTSDQFSQTD